MLEECRADGERGVLWEVRDRRRHAGPMFQHLILEAALTLKELCQSPFYRGKLRLGESNYLFKVPWRVAETETHVCLIPRSELPNYWAEPSLPCCGPPGHPPTPAGLRYAQEVTSQACLQLGPPG